MTVAALQSKLLDALLTRHARRGSRTASAPPSNAAPPPSSAARGW